MTRRCPPLRPALLAIVLALTGAGSGLTETMESPGADAPSPAPTRSDGNARKVCANYDRRAQQDAASAIASHFADFAQGCAEAIAVIWSPPPNATTEGLEAARAVLFAMVDHQMAVNALNDRHAARHASGRAETLDGSQRAHVPAVTRTGDYLIAVETGVPRSIALLRHRLGHQTTAQAREGGNSLR